MAELVGDRHQRDAACAGLQIFLGRIGGQPVEHRVQHGIEGLHGRADRDAVQPGAQQARGFRRVLQAFIAGVGRGHHHRPHLVGAQRIDGNGRGQRRIDAARHPDDDAGEAVLQHIVAHAQHEGLVDRLMVGGRGGHLARRADPAIPLAGPAGDGDTFLPGRHLQGQRAVGVEREGTAIEHQLVLAAQLVQIDQRQAGFDDARGGDVEAGIQFRTLEGGAIRHQQDFRAGFLQALDDFRRPDILADRHAEADAAEIHRPRQRPRLEYALFVEHAIVRQVVFEAQRLHLAAIQQGNRIVQLLAFRAGHAPGRAEQHRRPAIGGLLGEMLHRLHAGGDEHPLQHQIVRRIAGQEQLAGQQQVSALGGRLRPCPAQHGEIAVDIADGGVQLRERKGERVCHGW